MRGQPANPFHDAIIHLYYSYGKNSTAEFSAYFDPLYIAIKCSDKAGSLEIFITCSKHDNQNKFEIENTGS